MEALFDMGREEAAALPYPQLIPSVLEKSLEVFTAYPWEGRALLVEIRKSMESNLAATLFLVLGEER